MAGRRTLAGGCVRAAMALALVAAGVWVSCPRPALYGDDGFSTAVLDRDGGLLRLTLAADQRYRLFTPLDRVAPAAVEATLRYEDAYFYRHPGVNPAAILRAAWTTYLTGDRKVGASTITMQLARLRFGIDSSSPLGKIHQMLRALQLERHYGKNELLEAYLNLAPYGGNVEGIGTAARVYFDRPASELTTLQALTLAVIPQNPNARQPGPRRVGGPSEPPALVQARLRAFERWLEAHPADANLRSRVGSVLPARSVDALPFRAPHFVDRSLWGRSAGVWERSASLWERSASLWERSPDREYAHAPLHTTLSPTLQRLAERTVDGYVTDRRSSGIHNAAVLIVDARDMSVGALVGSADWFDETIQGQVNGTAARRSPGSVLKPFVYALALDQGLIHPMTLMKDAPVRYGAYTPENFDRGFLGPVLARDALIFSRNVPAVSLAARLQAPDFHGFLRNAGVGEMRDRDFYGLAIALGGIEVTMEEVAGLYASLYHGGVQRPLTFLAGRTDPAPAGRLLSPEAAFIALKMLEDNPRPDRLPLHRGDGSIPWKTGTSYGYRDAWTVGLAGPYVVAVWVGNFDGSPNPALVGRSAAAPLFFRLVDALEGEGVRTVPRQPDPGLNVRRVEVCAATGDLPNRHCPRRTRAWFIPGVSPIEVSNVYRAVDVDPATGKRVCPGVGAASPGVGAASPGVGAASRPRTVEVRVYEFWPSDLLALFRRAGLPRNTPPPFAEACSLTDTAATGEAPGIRSPQRTVVYALDAAATAPQRIPLQATADADASALFWFADDRFLGRVRPGETLFWQPRSGTFAIRVVDDLGRADSVDVRVRLIAASG